MSGGCTIFNGDSLLPIKGNLAKNKKIARKRKQWGASKVTLLTLLFVCKSTMADEGKLPLIQFTIKPRLCVLAVGEKVCHDELTVKWQAAENRSLCLYQSDKEEPLRCWEDATHGEYQFELTASVTTDFQLREMVTQKALSDQRFQVVYNDKKFRKERRNPWSFF